jgi:hypothetical protein
MTEFAAQTRTEAYSNLGIGTRGSAAPPAAIAMSEKSQKPENAFYSSGLRANKPNAAIAASASEMTTL